VQYETFSELTLSFDIAAVRATVFAFPGTEPDHGVGE
jgi:hypothetical protein